MKRLIVIFLVLGLGLISMGEMNVRVEASPIPIAYSSFMYHTFDCDTETCTHCYHNDFSMSSWGSLSSAWDVLEWTTTEDHNFYDECRSSIYWVVKNSNQVVLSSGTWYRGQDPVTEIYP